MDIEDIEPADLEALKEQGYSEGDLSMLAETEIQALLAKPGADDDTGGDADPHAAAAEQQDAAAAQAAADAAAATAAAAADADKGGAGGNISTDTPVDDGATQVRSFVAPQLQAAEVPTDITEQIAARRAEQKAALKAMMDGTSDVDAYQAVLDRTDAEIDALRSKAITASIYADVNRQTSEQQAEAEWQRAQAACFAEFKTAGIDYRAADRKGLLAAFNVHLKDLAADPKNEKRDGPWFLREADKLTRAELGIVSAQPGRVNTPRGVDQPEIPPTLRNVPAAASSAVNTDEFAHMRSLDGIELERAHAALTDAQRERWMNQ